MVEFGERMEEWGSEFMDRGQGREIALDLNTNGREWAQNVTNFSRHASGQEIRGHSFHSRKFVFPYFR